MSFNEQAAAAVENGDIGVGFLLDESGNKFWEVGEWEGFDPLGVLNDWKQSAMTPIIAGGLKFTIIGKTPERLVSTNVAGNGHLIGAKCTNWPGYLIAWCPRTVTPNVAYQICQQLADAVRP